MITIRGDFDRTRRDEIRAFVSKALALARELLDRRLKVEILPPLERTESTIDEYERWKEVRR
jgi:hypothetical protein